MLSANFILTTESLDILFFCEAWMRSKQLAGHSINQITAVLIRYVKPNVFSRMFHKPNPSQEVEERLREMFHTVFVVPDSIKIYQAQREGIPISHYAPESKVGKAYAKIAKSISMSTNQKPILDK